MATRAKLNAIDRLVGWLSPRAGAKRAYYRTALASFEGASLGRRTKHWRTSNRSANAELRGDLARLRARSRHLVQNNAYAASAKREISAHTVGTGIIPQARASTDQEQARIEALAKSWFDTTECDSGGQMSFYGIQDLVMATVVEAGECLVRRRRRRPSDRLTVPLQLQVLEPDHLDTTMDGRVLDNGDRIIQGVQFNALGRRVGYWLYPDHPGDLSVRSLQSSFVPAEDVAHVYRIDRAGQARGIPWGAPIIITLRDYDEYEDAQLVRQKMAACYTAFVTETDPLGTGQSENNDMELPDKLEPGTLEVLSGGKDIKFASPPGVEGYGDYSTITLHKVATGYGVPYSILTGDLRQVNFSSGRMGWLSFSRDIGQWQWNMMIPQLCNPVWRWFLDAASVAGLQRRPVPVTWTPPRREMVDPAKEVPAIRDAVRSGQMTQYEAIRQMGYDPDDFLQEVADGNRRLDELEIIFDSDPRKVSRAGLTQARAGGSEIPWEESDDSADE